MIDIVKRTKKMKKRGNNKRKKLQLHQKNVVIE
jgi:hypothetical protein